MLERYNLKHCSYTCIFDLWCLYVAQVLGRWKVNQPTLATLCKEAQSLIQHFSEFSIQHVDRVGSTYSEVPLHLLCRPMNQLLIYCSTSWLAFADIIVTNMFKFVRPNRKKRKERKKRKKQIIFRYRHVGYSFEILSTM